MDQIRHEAFLASIVENSEDAIISKDLSSRIVSWNGAAERTFGYTKEEIVGKLIHILIPPDRVSEEDEIIRKLKGGQKVDHFETVRVAKNGRLVHVSLSISPIRDTEGNIIGAAKIARDITRQKLLEERLAVTNAIARLISGTLEINTVLQSVAEAAIRLADAEHGAFLYRKKEIDNVTRWLQAWAGTGEQEPARFPQVLTTKLFSDIIEDNLPYFISENIEEDEDHRSEWLTGLSDAPYKIRSILVVPVVTLSGITTGAIFLFHSQSGMFSSEHALLISTIASQAAVTLDNAKLYEEVNFLNRRKDEFIGFASHELKTPLTAIKGYIQLAQEMDMPIDQLYPRLIKQVNRLEQLINDLLDLSKVQAGKMEYRITQFDLRELIREVIDVSEIRERKLEVELPEETVMVAADYAKLSQVLVNILSNAAKYSPEGSEIHITCQRDVSTVTIAVKDQGIGIHADELEKVFNLFYRAGNARAKGTGLGLYIAREIMEAHKGGIRVESKVGYGSTFYITLPALGSK